MIEFEPRGLPPVPSDAHKGQTGRLTCLAGSPQMPGAALLTARAATRAGAGLVTLAHGPGFDPTPFVVAVPEAILLPLDAADDEALFAHPCHARVAGPGWGQSPWTAAVLQALLERGGGVPLVLDADALNLVGRDLESLARFAGPLVLTPHPGEGARLLGRPLPSTREGRIESAIEIATRSNAICVLKGSGTVVTDGERVFVNTTGNAGMATAGSGDVLTGILGAYLTWIGSLPNVEWTALDAAARAVEHHGRAGDLAASERGLRGVTAGDLIEALPIVVARLDRSHEA